MPEPLQTPSTPSMPPKPEPKPKEEGRSRLLGLAVWTAALLLAALVLTVLLQLVSRETSLLTARAHAIHVLAVVAAVWILLAYPIWPGTLLGDIDAVDDFWHWLAARVVEVSLVLCVAVPFLLVATVLSGVPLWRVLDLVIGLSGTAAVAVAYRLVHRACSDRFRALALMDAALFVLGPLVVGYLLLEFYRINIGWCWLISPAALAHEVADDGLPLRSWSALIGIAGYTVIAALALALLRPMAAWYKNWRAKVAL